MPAACCLLQAAPSGASEHARAGTAASPTRRTLTDTKHCRSVSKQVAALPCEEGRRGQNHVLAILTCWRRSPCTTSAVLRAGEHRFVILRRQRSRSMRSARRALSFLARTQQDGRCYTSSALPSLATCLPYPTRQASTDPQPREAYLRGRHIRERHICHLRGRHI